MTWEELSLQTFHQVWGGGGFRMDCEGSRKERSPRNYSTRALKVANIRHCLGVRQTSGWHRHWSWDSVWDFCDTSIVPAFDGCYCESFPGEVSCFQVSSLPTSIEFFSGQKKDISGLKALHVDDYEFISLEDLLSEICHHRQSSAPLPTVASRERLQAPLP